ncbi:hypothetical protein [Brevundimonas sp. Root1423]|uniref:hypothetical protein n=1 Tax=Brevundimonas sp. Root1423 TaxID=1736462 RepID=UPI0006F4CADD|nr:hypothetical protein [Brevundimonas sp. Root1423]KQY80473.1 hypothetical protein ASD25_10135 [Brevundimonas sp. Root1423]
MNMFAAATTAVAVLLAAPAAQAQSAGLTGNWVHEGTQSELVIRSSIQTRAYSMPGDFSLGGTTPNTVISTTPTPTQVRREMALIVQADGTFSWVTDKTYAEGASCNVTIRQEKTGRLSVQGSQATFSIARGLERASRSCNDRVTEVDRSGRTETYRVTRSGASLRISDGTATWTFTPYRG